MAAKREIEGLAFAAGALDGLFASRPSGSG
jgi:hypothetical protein